MELIEWMRLIAPLLPGLYLSAMSELVADSSKSTSTPEGAFIQSTRKYLEKSLKILPITHSIQKILFDRQKPERLGRIQAGMIIPVYIGAKQ